MLVDFPRELYVEKSTVLLAIFLDMDYRLLQIPVIGKVYLQGFLLAPFCGVCPITFRGFLHAIDIRVLPTAYPYLLEVAAPFLVVERVDGEYLLLLYRGQAEDGGYVAIPVLELRLVEQDFHIGVVDDGLLDNGRIYHIVQLLSDHSGDTVELADGLV